MRIEVFELRGNIKSMESEAEEEKKKQQNKLEELRGIIENVEKKAEEEKKELRGIIENVEKKAEERISVMNAEMLSRFEEMFSRLNK